MVGRYFDMVEKKVRFLPPARQYSISDARMVSPEGFEVKPFEVNFDFDIWSMDYDVSGGIRWSYESDRRHSDGKVLL